MTRTLAVLSGCLFALVALLAAIAGDTGLMILGSSFSVLSFALFVILLDSNIS